MNFQMKARAVTAFLALTLLAACGKYNDSPVRKDIDDLKDRLTTLEERFGKGALIKSVTPITGEPGGWRIEFTSGTPSTIDIMNGAAASNLDPNEVTPLIEVRTNADGTVSVWYNTTAGYPDSGWVNTGTNIRGPQGAGGSGGTGSAGPAGVSPKVRVVDNGDGTITIQYNATAGYPDGGWTAAGSPIALDSNPRDKEAIFSIVKYEATGTITITLNDSDVAEERTAFDFAMASGAARFEIMTVRKTEFRSGATAQIRFVVNPSDAWIPTDPAKWELNAIDAVAAIDDVITRAGYVEASKHFRVTAITPAPDAAHKGEYFATIENFGTGADIADYTLEYHVALVLNTGTEAAPVLISSPAFVMGHIGIVADGTDGGITWVLHSDRILSIDGTGPIPDYEGDGVVFSNPWSENYHRMIESVVISEGITAIGDYAFPSSIYSQPYLQSVVIPGSVETIGYCAFANCDYLEQVTLPAGLKSIGAEAFYSAGLRSIVIPDKVETIGNSTFHACLSLTDITLGAGLKSIGQRAFYGCYRLAEITIPDGVETIGYQAFSGCPFLTDVTLGAGLKSIGQSAFSGSNTLTEIIIPDGVETIGDAAFQYCLSLADVTCLAADPPTLVGSMNFVQNTADVLHVPAASVDAYKNNTAWAAAFSSIEAIP